MPEPPACNVALKCSASPHSARLVLFFHAWHHNIADEHCPRTCMAGLKRLAEHKPVAQFMGNAHKDISNVLNARQEAMNAHHQQNKCCTTLQRQWSNLSNIQTVCTAVRHMCEPAASSRLVSLSCRHVCSIDWTQLSVSDEAPAR